MLRLASTAGTAPIITRSELPRKLRIGQLAAGDTATIRKVFDGLSFRSRQLRFHAGRGTLSAQLQQRLADVRPGAHLAYVARLTHRPVGIARWIRFAHDPHSAELAVEVIDAAQHHGIGRELIAVAARSAQAAGIQCLHAYITVDNSRLRASAVAYGGVADHTQPDLFRLSVVDVLAYLGQAMPIQKTSIPSRRNRVRDSPS